MKSSNNLFGSQNSAGRWKSSIPTTSTKLSIRGYDLKNHIHPHNLPIKHTPNTKIEQHDDKGNLIRIRYYDGNGNAYKDVDYTDHGRPETHKIPHTHIIEIGDIIDRKKGAKPHAY